MCTARDLVKAVPELRILGHTYRGERPVVSFHSITWTVESDCLRRDTWLISFNPCTDSASSISSIHFGVVGRAFSEV